MIPHNALALLRVARSAAGRCAAKERDGVTAITIPILAGAIQRVEALGFQERIDLADRIHAEQPTLLYSVLVRQRFGATMVQVEVLIELLLVAFTAMKAVGGKWPVISEELQERCLARIGGRARFIEGLAAPQVEAAIYDAAVNHPQALLLAHALDVMRRQGWLGIVDDTQKHLVLCGLNLVECIAEAAALRKR
jgi:hypothetical protein